MKTITVNRPKYRDQGVGDEFQINYQRYRVVKQFRGRNGMSKGCLEACQVQESNGPGPGDPVLVVYDQIVYKHAAGKLEE